MRKSTSTSCVNRSSAESDALHLRHVSLSPAVKDEQSSGDMTHNHRPTPDLTMTSAKTSESASSHCLYLVSWWADAVLRPGRWTSRSGCGQAGPSGSRSFRTPCRAQCGFRRPGRAPAAPSTACPARRSRTSADAPRTRLTGRHRIFITNHFLNLLEFVSGVNLGMRSL